MEEKRDDAVKEIENTVLRVEINEPGLHPFLAFNGWKGDGGWEKILILGACQVRYFHKGASFPRVFVEDREVEASPAFRCEVAQGGKAAAFSDQRGGLQIESRLALHDKEPVVRVEHRLRALAKVGLNRVFDRYDFVVAPLSVREDESFYNFVPHLRPRENMVIGEHVFRSPVIMTSSGENFFALIPDLAVLKEEYEKGTCHYYLDYLSAGGENQSPAACFGIGNTVPRGHVFFRSRFRKKIALEEGEEAVLAYYLLLAPSGLSRRDVLSFLWERFGREYFLKGVPQVLDLERCASAGLTRMFKKEDIFKEFELHGQPCGGTVGIHFATKNGVNLMSRKELEGYLKRENMVIFVQRHGLEFLSSRPWGVKILEKATYEKGTKVPPQIFFQSWYCNLRSAYGAYWFAKKWKDRELLESSIAVKNLAVLAPREEGLFPAVCFPTEEGVFWSKGTMAFRHIEEYHIPDCATTGYYMLMWHRDNEGDPRLLKRAKELADFIVKIQLPSGAIPPWVSPGTGSTRVSEILKESASSSCPAMFLAALCEVEREEKYFEAAMRAARFLMNEVMPYKKWFDYETFFSCSHKPLGFYDRYTATHPQNTMSMYWTAEAMRILYGLTGDRALLEAGLSVLDEICLYQQVWDPPFLGINCFGGFGVMNTDAEWNDARQALFSTLLMDYYRLTGNREYMERAIAALRASFTTMYIEEHKRIAPGNMRFVPPHEIGSISENYGHFGFDYRTTGILQSDWGAGSACFAAAYAQRHYGDILIDLSRDEAFGINGCTVRSFERRGVEVSLEVEKHEDSGLDLTVRTLGAESGKLRLRVNGRELRQASDGSLRIYL